MVSFVIHIGANRLLTDHEGDMNRPQVFHIYWKIPVKVEAWVKICTALTFCTKHTWAGIMWVYSKQHIVNTRSRTDFQQISYLVILLKCSISKNVHSKSLAKAFLSLLSIPHLLHDIFIGILMTVFCLFYCPDTYNEYFQHKQDV